MTKEVFQVTVADVLSVMISYGADNWDTGGTSLEVAAQIALGFLDFDEIEDPSICGFENDPKSYSPYAEIGRQLMYMSIWAPRWEFGHEMPTLTSFPVPSCKPALNKSLGMVTESGVAYEELLTPVNRMLFILLNEPETTEKQLKDGAAQLRRRFGVIGPIGMTQVSITEGMLDINLPD